MTAESIQLRPEVQLVRRDGGVTLLHSPVERRTVRVSRGGEALLPALTAGTTVDALLGRLGRTGPEATAALTAFLDRLRSAGMLAGCEAAAPPTALRMRLKPLVDINPLARVLARPLLALPQLGRRALAVIAVSLAVGGLATLASTHGRPELTGVFWGFDVWAVVWLLTVHTALHEIGHAVASHVAGIRVASAGVMFGRFGLPVAYVLTPDIMRISERLPRFWVAAGGPFVDLLAVGAAAWIAVAVPGGIGHAASYFCFLGLLTLVANLNPWLATDGSHMLQAALNDDQVRAVVRGRAPRRMTPERAVRVYRRVAIAYLIVVAVAMAGVWRLP